MSTETADGEEDAGGVPGIPDPVEIDDGTPVLSGSIAVFAAVIAMLTSAPFLGLAFIPGLAGVLFVAAGVFATQSRSYVSLGVASIFVGVLLVGAMGAGPPMMLVTSAVGVFVAWDVGQHAITISEQFGRSAPTQRGELVHAGGSSLVGILSAGILYGIFLAGSGGKPALAVILMTTGFLALMWALRD